MATSPSISVLIPAYNHAEYIEECIQSIWDQHGFDIEIVLVDDGSTDATAERASAMAERSPVPMRVLQQENRGINPTLNRLLHLARGELVALISSDDKFAASRFDTQAALFLEQPELCVVYGNGRYWTDGHLGERVHGHDVEALLRQAPESILRHLLVNVSPLFVQTCLFRREFLLSVGGYDESMLADDWVLNIRIFRALSRTGKFAYVDQDLFCYRQHSTNVYKKFPQQCQRIIQVIDTHTPAEFRRTFKARIYREFVGVALTQRKLGWAVRYLMKSLMLTGTALLSSVGYSKAKEHGGF